MTANASVSWDQICMMRCLRHLRCRPSAGNFYHLKDTDADIGEVQFKGWAAATPLTPMPRKHPHPARCCVSL